jgi:hypothetical protein
MSRCERWVSFAFVWAVGLVGACGKGGEAAGSGQGGMAAQGAGGGQAAAAGRAGSAGDAGAGTGTAGAGGAPAPAGVGGAPAPAGAGGGPVPAGAGSTGTAGGPTEPTNTRLEAWQLEAEGAPALPLGGFWDTAEQVACQFRLAADGLLRCLPDQPDGFSGTDTFADPQCQQTIFVAFRSDGQAASSRPWTVPIAQTACEPVRYQPLRPIPADSALYRVGDTGSGCQRIPAGELSFPQLMMVADTPDRWQPGTESDGRRLSDRLRTMEIATADGVRFVSRVIDDRWTADCAFYPPTAADGVECRPPTVTATGSLFADDACMTNELISVLGCGPPPALIQRGSARFALGAQFLGTPFQLDPKRGCLTGTAPPADGPTGTHLYLVGASAGADAIATARRGTAGTGRFRLQGLLDAHDALVAIGANLYPYGGGARYADSVANEDCSPVWTPDGAVRCAPASVAILTPPIYFTDAGCTKPSFYCTKGDACDTQKVILTTHDARGRYVATAAYATSTRLAMTNLYSGSPGSCSQVGANVGNNSVLGTPLSWDTLPTLHERNPMVAPLP